MGGAARLFDLQLERLQLRALRVAILAGDPIAGGDGEVPDWVGAELTACDEQCAELRSGGPMAWLADRFGLGPQEVDLVWTVAAAAVEPRAFHHLRAAFGSDVRSGLSVGAYALLVGARSNLAELVGFLDRRHPLLQNHLLIAHGDRLTTASPLTAARRLIDFLRGDDRVDDVVAEHGGLVEMPAEHLLDDRQRETLTNLRSAVTTERPALLVIEGPRGAGRRTAVAIAASDHRRATVAIDADRVAPTADQVERVLDALHRDCLLRGAVPIIANVDCWSGPEHAALQRPLARFVAGRAGPTVVTAVEGGLDLPLEQPIVRFRWALADLATRRQQWRDALGDRAADLSQDLGALAHRYRLGPGGIRRAVRSAALLATAGDRSLTDHDLVLGVRSNTAERLGKLATRIEVKESWTDLVLPDDTQASIRRLIERVRHSHQVYEEWGFNRRASRGVGIPALFSGPPGTGKTMVAGIVANELDLELFQIDLSQIVSKWIGETEKNLGQVFEAAEGGHALLLFDEADALFAKRSSDVKSAQDRYANLEVNYLLQRIEAFSGIAILTTNLDTSIDKALKRRLAEHIIFYQPDEDERTELWRRMVTSSDAPVEDGDLDFAALSRAYPDMSGAHIRNAVLTAAFAAAASGGAITYERLNEAARVEYRTMGRVLTTR